MSDTSQLVEFYYVTEEEYKNSEKKENALYFCTSGRLFKGELEIAPKDESSVQTYESLYHFPSVGKENILYIDMTENKTYRWDDANLRYYCIGSDYEDIKIINGNSI